MAASEAVGPDMIVADEDLSDGDGVMLLGLLASGDDPLRVPRGIIVGSGAADATLDAFRAGAAAYVSKADGLRGLTGALRAVAREERVLSEVQHVAVSAALARRVKRLRVGTPVERGLTRREREVLSELVSGRTVRQVASRLGVSVKTVETHITHLYRKLGVRSRVQAISRAAALGLVDLGRELDAPSRPAS
jgi:DNA-binding NarL/FixJ family response regulator